MPFLTSVGPDDDWQDLVLIACHDRATAEEEDDADQYQQWAVRYLDLPLRAAARGHTMAPDPPANALSTARRWTCLVCGAAALGHGTRLYGKALDTDCDLQQKEAAARAAARAAGYPSPAEVAAEAGP